MVSYKHILFAVGATALIASCSNHKKTDATSGETAMAVNVAHPEVDSIVLHKEYPAVLSATSKTNVVVKVNGYVTAKHFDDGQWVNQGQVLFSIEPTTYTNALNQAQAQLQTAIANNEYATKEYEAMKKALESDAVSKMDVIQAESAMRQSEAAIKTAKAAVSDASTNLGYCSVKAPISGRVAAPTIDVGDYVTGGAAPQVITYIVDDAMLNANFSVDNDQFVLMTETPAGKAVDYKHIPVTFNDTISKTYYGYLDYTSPDVSTSTGTVTLRVKVPNKEGELLSGMYGTVHLPYANEPNALLIKDASIGTDQLGKYVYTVNDSNKVVYTPIEIGEIYHDTLRVVNSGLTAKDRYVTEALLKVRDGMTVKPVVTGENK